MRIHEDPIWGAAVAVAPFTRSSPCKAYCNSLSFSCDRRHPGLGAPAPRPGPRTRNIQQHPVCDTCGLGIILSTYPNVGRAGTSGAWREVPEADRACIASDDFALIAHQRGEREGLSPCASAIIDNPLSRLSADKVRNNLGPLILYLYQSLAIVGVRIDSTGPGHSDTGSSIGGWFRIETVGAQLLQDV